MTAELRAFANRLADEIEAARPLEHMKSHPIVRALRKIADEPSCQCHPSAFGFHDASCPTLNQDPELIRVNREWAKLHDQQMDDAREAKAEADRLRGELADMEKRKDGAYEERNRVVALLAALYPSKRCRTAIEGWSDDWHGCVYIETPEGQLSWHYHDSQASMFAHVPEGAASWDGHTTEEKYRRVDRLCVNAAPAQRFTQPTDEERQRLADMARYYGGQGASSLVYVRADDMRRIATILEQPAPPRKSIGRRWVVRFADGEYSTRAYSYRGDAETAAKASGGTVVLCDLVPVEGEEP